MAQKIIEVSLDSLKEQPDNPNKMDDEHFKLLVESMRVNGFLQPILVSPNEDKTYTIADGHHRARAAREIGMVSIPALLKPLDPKRDLKAVQVGMNKLRGELDLSKVATVMMDLTNDGTPIDYLSITTGFTPDEISDLLDSVRGTTEEDILASAPITHEEEKPIKPFVLEIEFSTREEMQETRRVL